MPAGFSDEVQDIVQSHQAHTDENDPKVNDANPEQHGRGIGSWKHMHRPECETRPSPRMAFPTGLGKVGRMNMRIWV